MKIYKWNWEDGEDEFQEEDVLQRKDYWFCFNDSDYKEEYFPEEGWKDNKKDALKFAKKQIRKTLDKEYQQIEYLENRIDTVKEMLEKEEKDK